MTKPTTQSEQIAALMSRTDTLAYDIVNNAATAVAEQDRAMADVWAAAVVVASANHAMFAARVNYRTDPNPENLRAVRDAHDLWADANRAKLEADIMRDRAVLATQMFVNPWADNSEE